MTQEITENHIKPGSMPRPETPDPRMPRLADSATFNEHMSQGWAVPDRRPPMVPGAAAAADEHRARLSAQLPGRTIIVSSGVAPTRSNDTAYDFRPDSNFYWLTGCAAENTVLVMTPTSAGHDSVVITPEPFYPGDPGFYSNARYGELWVGSAPGPEDWAQALQVEVRGEDRLEGILDTLKDPMIAGTHERVIDRFGAGASGRLAQTLDELRMIKDAWEIQQLTAAINHTVSGFAAVAGEIPTAIAGGGERWLQGTFDRHARTNGNGAGYATIVGSGRHAATLHWVRCDGPVLADDLVLLDMGVETNSYYTADVTRTLPASGKFSAVQRQVHDLVEKSHRAGMAEVAPGKSFIDFHTASMEVIVRGLKDWGLLKVSVDEALSPEGQQHRRYLVCGVGHHLGLEVHDCAQSRYEHYQGANLAPGMVLTVEPGLYFHENDLTLPPELRGIGVRLEDDLLVTDSGAEILSDALPIDASGVEGWFAQHSRS